MCSSKVDFTYVSKNINPSDYNEVGYCFMFYDEFGEFLGDEAYENKDIEKRFTESYLKGNNKCSCCNKKVKHVVIFQHNDGSLISVGRNCAQTILETSKESEFKNAQKKNMLARQREIKNNKLQAIYSQYPQLQEGLTAPHYIIDNIKTSMKKWCKISEKQAALVSKLANEFRAKEFNPNVLPCPTFTKKEFVGDLEVVSIKSNYYHDDEMYSKNSFGKLQFKVVLKSKDGWAVSCNLRSMRVYNSFEGLRLGHCTKFGEFDDMKQEEIEAKIKAKFLNKTLKNVSFRKISVSKDPYFGFASYLKYDEIV
tara:strand:- start:7156 stop:8085 length:930 start_codon:yes stop_codon:yes gene_type:complete